MNSPDLDNSEERFLQEYAALAHVYKQAIASCGCCGGPFVIPLEDPRAEKHRLGDTFEYLMENSSYAKS